MAGGSYEGAPGQVIDGRFELLRRLGRGGMGTVWRAHDLALERDVALKEVRTTGPGPHPAEEDAELRARVLQEARALARINHPHVVTVHHIVDARPYPWIVMELLPGRTLATQLRQGPVAPGEAARWGGEVLSALRAAHRSGILHRDVKPANVLLNSDGAAVLTDFGIARATDVPVSSARVVGSPEYLAPERITGSPGDAASDLWSLGVLLYALVQGESPFRRATPEETLRAVVEEPVPTARMAGPLTTVLEMLLVKDPDSRVSAEELARRLDDLEHSESTQAGLLPPPPRPPAGAPTAPPHATAATHSVSPHPGAGELPTLDRAARPASRRRPAVLAGVVAAAVLLGGGLTVALLNQSSGDGHDQGRGAEDPTTAPEQEDPAPSEDDPESGQRPGLPVPPAITESGDDPEDTDDEAPPPPDEEITDDELAHTWIAQLFSEPVSSGTGVRDQRLTAIRAEVPSARVLRSDDYPSLVPGYWVIYASGPFNDGREAVRFCAGYGRTSANECVGRYLSESEADRELVCHPDSGGSGRCDE